MSARNTSSAPTGQTRRTGSAGADGQWWKAWVLLTGLGATAFGWMAFPYVEQPAAAGGISPPTSLSVENKRLVRVEPIGGPKQPSTSARTLPAMPHKPVFQAPVTRTRRS